MQQQQHGLVGRTDGQAFVRWAFFSAYNLEIFFFIDFYLSLLEKRRRVGLAFDFDFDLLYNTIQCNIYMIAYKIGNILISMRENC
jgi:hypothetical protein